MGVPDNLSKKWMGALEKAKGTSKMKIIKNRVAFVPYDDAIGFTPNKTVEYSDDVYLADAELIHFNQHSGRLGAWGETVGAKLDQNKKRDFERIRMRNIVNPQITLNESKDFQKRIKNETQQVVAIAQADGVLIDGNRRFANLLEIGVKKLYVYILPEYVHPEDLEAIEGKFSFQSDTRVRYTEYLRGVQITKKIKKIMPKGSLSESDFLKEAKKALVKEDSFLKSISMTGADALKLVQAVFEGEQWCKANGFVIGGKGDTDVLEDKTKTGKTTPGFEVFLRSVGMINKAQGRTEAEKMKEKMIVRKMVWSAVNPKISGRAADRVDKIKIVMNNAKVKNHVFSNAQVVTGSSWKKPSSWDDLEKQIAVGKVAGKSNASVAKVKNSHKSLESVKISEIKSSHRKELNPLVKEMKDKLKKITDKISQ